MQAETNAVHRAGLGSNINSQRKVGGSKKAEMHHISSLSRKSGNARRKIKKRSTETRMVKTDAAGVLNIKTNGSNKKGRV